MIVSTINIYINPICELGKSNAIMGNIVKQLTELIGNTPLLEITNYEKENELQSKIIGKLEYFNRQSDKYDFSMRCC